MTLRAIGYQFKCTATTYGRPRAKVEQVTSAPCWACAQWVRSLFPRHNGRSSCSASKRRTLLRQRIIWPIPLEAKAWKKKSIAHLHGTCQLCCYKDLYYMGAQNLLLPSCTKCTTWKRKSIVESRPSSAVRHGQNRSNTSLLQRKVACGKVPISTNAEEDELRASYETNTVLMRQVPSTLET